MTDSAGPPAEPDPPAGDETPSQEGPAGVEEGAGARARAGRPAGAGGGPGTSNARTGARAAAGGGEGDAPRARRWLRWTALGCSVVVLAAAGAGWWFYRKLDNNITTDTSAAAELLEYEKERPSAVVSSARNILLIGSDTRAGAGNSRYGKDKGTQHSDTTILLHLSAGKSNATAVSVPRDLMVEIPDCRAPDGTRTGEQFTQFNLAFEIGGTACTIRTIERLTGIRMDHHMVIDFQGFKKMVDAVNGVEICLKEPIDDDGAHLKLPAGRQTLRGEQALGFVRARKSLGNGSDTERMDRQQQFLGALVNKVQSNGVLLNPTRLYPVLDAATKSITTDRGLDSLRDLYDLARSMRAVPTEKVQFLTVPRQPYSYNANRDELVQPEASQLFKQLREDKPVTVKPGGTPSSSESAGEGTGRDGKPDDAGSPSPAPTPTFSGRNAAEGACS
ncbi:LCP family protein [Streptomyces sp. NPDC002992]|uniref:LCP family protein n=1 Tax=Streptomyces sp. NPDC002992 TaxID=3154273 RepID=UPI0033A4D88D